MVRLKSFIVYCFIVLTGFLNSCDNDSKSHIPTLIKISHNKSVDDWIDLPLTIAAAEVKSGYIEFLALAILDSDTVGLQINLKTDIEPGFINGEPNNMFVEKGIVFVSLGTKSDKLLYFLADEYKVKTGTRKLKKQQIFTCANLTKQPINYTVGDSNFKMFFEEDTTYAELFVNFNFTNKTISLNEKDTGYRENLIFLLSE